MGPPSCSRFRVTFVVVVSLQRFISANIDRVSNGIKRRLPQFTKRPPAYRLLAGTGPAAAGTGTVSHHDP